MGTAIKAALERLAAAARIMHPAGPAEADATPEDARPITSARMVLRRLRAGDCVEFLRVMRLNREHLARFFPLARGCESDLAIFSRELRLAAIGGRTGDWRRAAFAPDGRLVGCFNLNAITRGLVFRAETTFWINREFAGRGYAKEGLRAVVDHAFADPALPRDRSAPADRPPGLGLHRIDAFVDRANTA